jgi:hypothetical protein
MLKQRLGLFKKPRVSLQEDTKAAKQAVITLQAHAAFCEALKQSLLEHIQKCLEAGTVS